MKQKFILTVVDMLRNTTEAYEQESMILGVRGFNDATEKHGIEDWKQVGEYSLIAISSTCVITLVPLS